MADKDLPVFSLVPNWRQGIVERLEWLTDVMRSESGHEQRRSLRSTPRRYFEATFNPFDEDRTFLDLWFKRFAEREFLLPLWHDKAKLGAALAPGAVRLPIDNTYREFETGGLALLYASTFRFEVVTISGQDGTGLDVSATIRTWPAGTVIHPLRPAYLEDPGGQLSAIVNHVGSASLSFQLSRANPYDPGAEALPTFSGLPIILQEPNRAEELRVSYERATEDMDTKLGRIYRRDEVGSAFETQFHDWQAVGRKAHHELRQTLYRLHGRQKPLWLPTFNRDVALAASLSAVSTNMVIKEVGYRHLGGAISGRDVVMLRDQGGTPRYASISGTATGPGLTEETLVLAGALGAIMPAGTTGSFVRQARLDQDAIEIMHHTDTDGATEASAAFKTFVPGRSTAGPLVDPFDTGVMGVEPCGIPPSLPSYDFALWPALRQLRKDVDPEYPGATGYHPGSITIGPFFYPAEIRAKSGLVIQADDQFTFGGVAYPGNSSTNFTYSSGPFLTLPAGQTVVVGVKNNAHSVTGASNGIITAYLIGVV